MDNSIMVLDIETGGFSSTKNAICSIAWIIVPQRRLSEILEQKDFTIKPYFRDEQKTELASYKDSAMEKNGLKVEDLQANGTDLKKVLELFHQAVVKHNVTTFVAHNVEFDIPFIRHAFNVHAQHLFCDFGKTICTLKLARMYLGLQNNDLRSVAEHFGILKIEYHTAKSDTEACHLILIEIIKKIKNEKKVGTQGSKL